MKSTTACGLLRATFAAAARLNFWFAASVDAKFILASIAPVENQPSPSVQPATSGGSNKVWFMLMSGDRTEPAENPVHPTSFIARTTNSAGHEYRVKKLELDSKAGEVNSTRRTGAMAVLELREFLCDRVDGVPDERLGVIDRDEDP